MRTLITTTALMILVSGGMLAQELEEGFVSLFDGKTLNGWTLSKQRGPGYTVEDGMIVCPKGGGGDLLSEKEFSNFILRFEFRLEPGSNNGLGIRVPMGAKDAAYDAIELQIIDDYAEKYAELKPWQRHGSLYHVVPAKTGALKPAGEWNFQEVVADGTQIRVILNGTTILDANTADVTDPELLAKHPGLKRTSGHLGFLGHNDPVQFRNIRIKELP